MDPMGYSIEHLLLKDLRILKKIETLHSKVAALVRFRFPGICPAKRGNLFSMSSGELNFCMAWKCTVWTGGELSTAAGSKTWRISCTRIDSLKICFNSQHNQHTANKYCVNPLECKFLDFGSFFLGAPHLHSKERNQTHNGPQLDGLLQCETQRKSPAMPSRQIPSLGPWCHPDWPAHHSRTGSHGMIVDDRDVDGYLMHPAALIRLHQVTFGGRSFCEFPKKTHLICWVPQAMLGVVGNPGHRLAAVHSWLQFSLVHSAEAKSLAMSKKCSANLQAMLSYLIDSSTHRWTFSGGWNEVWFFTDPRYTTIYIY